MRKKEMSVVIPTADLLTEMDSVEIVGGIGDISGNYVLARCPQNGNCPTNGNCSGGNCVSGCGSSGFDGEN